MDITVWAILPTLYVVAMFGYLRLLGSMLSVAMADLMTSTGYMANQYSKPPSPPAVMTQAAGSSVFLQFL